MKSKNNSNSSFDKQYNNKKPEANNAVALY